LLFNWISKAGLLRNRISFFLLLGGFRKLLLGNFHVDPSIN
jgi:hypothetical protein